MKRKKNTIKNRIKKFIHRDNMRFKKSNWTKSQQKRH